MPLGHQTKTGLTPAQTEVGLWGWALCLWEHGGQACQTSLREDSKVTPSTDMGPLDGKASLCRRGSHLPPWEHESDQSRGVNSGVGASLARGRGAIPSGLQRPGPRS